MARLVTPGFSVSDILVSLSMTMLVISNCASRDLVTVAPCRLSRRVGVARPET
jgi:hypothetical protein